MYKLLNQPGFDGMTPFQVAIVRGDLESIRLDRFQDHYQARAQFTGLAFNKIIQDRQSQWIDDNELSTKVSSCLDRIDELRMYMPNNLFDKNNPDCIYRPKLLCHALGVLINSQLYGSTCGPIMITTDRDWHEGPIQTCYMHYAGGAKVPVMTQIEVPTGSIAGASVYHAQTDPLLQKERDSEELTQKRQGFYVKRYKNAIQHACSVAAVRGTDLVVLHDPDRFLLMELPRDPKDILRIMSASPDDPSGVEQMMCIKTRKSRVLTREKGTEEYSNMAIFAWLHESVFEIAKRSNQSVHPGSFGEQLLTWGKVSDCRVAQLAAAATNQVSITWDVKLCEPVFCQNGRPDQIVRINVAGFLSTCRTTNPDLLSPLNKYSPDQSLIVRILDPEKAGNNRRYYAEVCEVANLLFTGHGYTGCEKAVCVFSSEYRIPPNIFRGIVYVFVDSGLNPRVNQGNEQRKKQAIEALGNLVPLKWGCADNINGVGDLETGPQTKAAFIFNPLPLVDWRQWARHGPQWKDFEEKEMFEELDAPNSDQTQQLGCKDESVDEQLEWLQTFLHDDEGKPRSDSSSDTGTDTDERLPAKSPAYRQFATPPVEQPAKWKKKCVYKRSASPVAAKQAKHKRTQRPSSLVVEKPSKKHDRKRTYKRSSLPELICMQPTQGAPRVQSAGPSGDDVANQKPSKLTREVQQLGVPSSSSQQLASTVVNEADQTMYIKWDMLEPNAPEAEQQTEGLEYDPEPPSTILRDAGALILDDNLTDMGLDLGKIEGSSQGIDKNCATQ